MIIVTGGAGFIGSNIIKTLNARGYTDVVAVDNIQQRTYTNNLCDCEIYDYLDKADFIKRIRKTGHVFNSVDAILHQGACTDTTDRNINGVLQNNYEYSKELVLYCTKQQIPFIYASSAAVYGRSLVFKETDDFCPLNIYGYSKLLVDRYVRSILPSTPSQIVGLRYFNVYGPRETHKRAMASVPFQLNHQLVTTGKVELYSLPGGYANGGQKRDFLHVDDVVSVNLWFLEHTKNSGIFNVGTGKGRTFNELASAVLRYHGFGEIEYIPLPDHQRGHYQSFTEADISSLRKAGYTRPFIGIDTGIPMYMKWLSRADET